MTLHAQEYWKQRFAANREQLEQTRQAGLAQAALLEAIALAEDAGPLPVDLKRQDDLSDDLVERLLRKSQTL